ncbi:HAMP domain-containing histidine kinase [Sphingobacterium shayense]|uniref:sensor histidine kinase n=1 Tax=Sphingobacterium shayense TaxID=626343 RepID=UPI00155801EA|nr:HAMP domain-containing sensor histidine kinase [Sphingobacterium shayense]NQD70854.1 HAMP domain-containing histidine kinase [Sphingobacterium shayense]
MKIKAKIILSFSLIAIGLIALFAYYVSYFTRDSLQTKFYHRLEENARIVGGNIIQNNSYNNRIYYEVKRKYLKQLSEGKDHLLRIVKGSKELRYRPELPMPVEFYQEAIIEGKASYLHKNKSYVALFFEDSLHPENLLVISEGIDDYGHSEQEDLDRTLLTGGLISLFFIITLAFYFANRILKPLKVLNDELEKVNIATLDHRLKNRFSSKGDEIDQLYGNYNSMLDRLDIAVQVQKSFIGNASHSLRTPLTIIGGEAELAQGQLDSSHEAYESVETIILHTNKMKFMIKDLLVMSSLGSERKIKDELPVRIDELIFEVIKTETELNSKSKVQFDLTNIPEDSDDLMVKANPDLFYIAFSNILSNAIKYGNQKPVQIHLDFDQFNVIIKIIDHGIGIPAKDQSNIYYSFFRASNVGEIYGNGLGLVLARNIFILHNAQLELDSQENQGTTVTVKIPRSGF